MVIICNNASSEWLNLGDVHKIISTTQCWPVITGMRVEAQNGLERNTCSLRASCRPSCLCPVPVLWRWIRTAYSKALCLKLRLAACSKALCLSPWLTTATSQRQRGKKKKYCRVQLLWKVWAVTTIMNRWELAQGQVWGSCIAHSWSQLWEEPIQTLRSLFFWSWLFFQHLICFLQHLPPHQPLPHLFWALSKPSMSGEAQLKILDDENVQRHYLYYTCTYTLISSCLWNAKCMHIFSIIFPLDISNPAHGITGFKPPCAKYCTSQAKNY